MKLITLLRTLSPSIKYRVVLQQSICDALHLTYQEVVDVKDYLLYEVAIIEKDFTIVIKEKKIMKGGITI